jgi:hypothetical protein
LYLNHVINPGWYPLKLRTKKEYLITSVTLHATSILEYPALLAKNGKLFTTPQTRSRRDEICIAVVERGARTRPVSANVSSLANATQPKNVKSKTRWQKLSTLQGVGKGVETIEHLPEAA